jgi:hypothetical protein
MSLLDSEDDPTRRTVLCHGLPIPSRFDLAYSYASVRLGGSRRGSCLLGQALSPRIRIQRNDFSNMNLVANTSITSYPRKTSFISLFQSHASGELLA